MATVTEVSKETYAINQDVFSTHRDCAYVVLVEQEEYCVVHGRTNPGMFTKQIQRILVSKGDISKTTSLYPRMNELHRSGMIVKVGETKDGKNPVELWRPSTRDERRLLDMYRITGYPTISTNMEMMRIINWLSFTKTGRSIWKQLPTGVKQIFDGMKWEASKQNSKDLTIGQISAYNGDIERFMIDGCKRYVKVKLANKEKQSKQKKDDIGEENKARLLKYRAHKVKAARAKREAE